MKIFVTYSWIDEKPDDNALKLIDALIKKDYDVVYDKILRQKETAINFNKMMAEYLQKSDKVIIVLSKQYKEKADSFKGGVGSEYEYILEDIKEKKQKYIFVTFDDRDRVTPDFLRGRDILILDKFEIISNDLLLKITEASGMVNQEEPQLISRKINKVSNSKEKNKSHIINLPHTRNPYFTGRKEILKLIHENFHDNADVTRIKHIQSVCGLGGMGKTSLVLEYAYVHRLEYQTIWWVNAESQNAVLSSYRRFALEQGLASEDDKDYVIIKEIQNWFFENEYWLFIYDNVDAANYDNWFEGYLPKERNGHVLITTRNYTFKKSKSIDICVFNEAEAISFLKIRTDKNGNGYSDDSAKKLAKLLQYLPLALEQAAAYIVETPGVIYQGYINLFTQYGINIFNAKTSLVDYNSTITITWKISMAKITNESAIQMFNMCAYLAPDSIPVEMFIRGKETLPEPLQRGINDNLQRDAILADLVRYSLFGCERDESVPNDEKRLLYMHRLLQEVVRENFGEDSNWLAHCLNLIYKVFNWKGKDKELMNSFRLESPHAVIVAEKSYEVFTEDNEKLSNIAEIFFGISVIYAKVLYNMDSAISCCDKCIEITGRLYSENVITGDDLFIAYANRGLIHSNMIDYDKAIEDYDRSIDIGEQMRIESNLLIEDELAKTYMNRAVAYECMKLHDKALSDKNKSIDIYESMYKASILDDENGLALAYMNRGVTYESMLKYNESLSDTNKAIEIWKKLKKEGKKINEDDLAKACLNRSVTSAKVVLKKNEERLSNDSALIYDRNSSNAQLNYLEKQHSGGNK